MFLRRFLLGLLVFLAAGAAAGAEPTPVGLAALSVGDDATTALATARAADPAAAPATVPAADPAADPATAPATVPATSPATARVVALLDAIEARHGGLETLVVEFHQVRVQEVFEDEVRSGGKLRLKLPDMLRCDYDAPEPSTLLFTNDALYQHTPSIRQVDKFVYASPEAAREQFRLMLLCFGLSSGEVLESYGVEDAPAEAAGEHPETRCLRFVPRNEGVAKLYEEILAWIDPESLLPTHVRFREVSGDITTLTMDRISVDDPLEDGIFRPDFPGAEVIEH